MKLFILLILFISTFSAYGGNSPTDLYQPTYLEVVDNKFGLEIDLVTSIEIFSHNMCFTDTKIEKPNKLFVTLKCPKTVTGNDKKTIRKELQDMYDEIITTYDVKGIKMSIIFN